MGLFFRDFKGLEGSEISLIWIGLWEMHMGRVMENVYLLS